MISQQKEGCIQIVSLHEAKKASLNRKWTSLSRYALENSVFERA